MTSEFFSGLGPGNLTFGPDSATSLVMGQSGPVQEVLNSYYMTGQTSGLYTFGGLEWCPQGSILWRNLWVRLDGAYPGATCHLRARRASDR